MQLRDYQEEDIQALMTLDAMGLFNEQRTGKTPTAIITMERRGVAKLLIICPASMCYKWAEEYHTWTNGKKAYVITSGKDFLAKETMPKCNAIIVNYENLRDNGDRHGVWEKLLKKYKPDGVIVDEIHRTKDRTTANFKAVNKFNKVKYRLALTGTPAPNKAWDIWSILHFIAPNVYTSYWKFIETFFDQTPVWTPRGFINNVVGFQEGAEEILQCNLSHVSIMRKRKDVMPWLPDEEAPTIIKLPCTATQKKQLEELTAYFETEGIVTQNVLEKLIRVRQICAAPSILKLRGTSPKIDWLQQYINDYPEKSIIVFSNSTRFINLIETKIKCSTITGDVPLNLRQCRINKFQKGVEKVIVIQTQAGKEGLTLDQADVTIFLDTYPPAADYLQAKDRMVSTTPERVKPKEIIHVMMEGTYDEQLYQLVQHNVDATDVINNFISYIKRR